jgi:hypothetical protein
MGGVNVMSSYLDFGSSPICFPHRTKHLGRVRFSNYPGRVVVLRNQAGVVCRPTPTAPQISGARGWFEGSRIDLDVIVSPVVPRLRTSLGGRRLDPTVERVILYGRSARFPPVTPCQSKCSGMNGLDTAASNRVRAVRDFPAIWRCHANRTGNRCCRIRSRSRRLTPLLRSGRT